MEDKTINLDFIKKLYDEGYKNIVIPKGSRTKLLATKAELPLGDEDTIDEYVMETPEEKVLLKVLPRRTWIDITK